MVLLDFIVVGICLPLCVVYSQNLIPIARFSLLWVVAIICWQHAKIVLKMCMVFLWILRYRLYWVIGHEIWLSRTPSMIQWKIWKPRSSDFSIALFFKWWFVSSSLKSWTLYMCSYCREDAIRFPVGRLRFVYGETSFVDYVTSYFATKHPEASVPSVGRIEWSEWVEDVIQKLERDSERSFRIFSGFFVIQNLYPWNNTCMSS